MPHPSPSYLCAWLLGGLPPSALTPPPHPPPAPSVRAGTVHCIFRGNPSPLLLLPFCARFVDLFVVCFTSSLRPLCHCPLRRFTRTTQSTMHDNSQALCMTRTSPTRFASGTFGPPHKLHQPSCRVTCCFPGAARCGRPPLSQPLAGAATAGGHSKCCGGGRPWEALAAPRPGFLSTLRSVWSPGGSIKGSYKSQKKIDT